MFNKWHKHNKHFATLFTATEALWNKENHTKNCKKKNAKEKVESVKTEQSINTNFFEALPWLKLKNDRLNKVS